MKCSTRLLSQKAGRPDTDIKITGGPGGGQMESPSQWEPENKILAFGLFVLGNRGGGVPQQTEPDDNRHSYNW